MGTLRQIRILEGLGYVAALMIGAAGFTDRTELRWFNIAGLMFGLIAVVRLLGVNMELRLSLLSGSEKGLPEPEPGMETEEQEEQK